MNLYDKIIDLTAQGHSTASIQRELGLTRRVVQKAVELDAIMRRRVSQEIKLAQSTAGGDTRSRAGRVLSSDEIAEIKAQVRAEFEQAIRREVRRFVSQGGAPLTLRRLFAVDKE